MADTPPPAPNTPPTPNSTPGTPSASTAAPKVNLADFDNLGGVTPSIPAAPIAAQAASGSTTPAQQPAKPINPKRVAWGCFSIFIILFILLIAAMGFGLASGEKVIQSFGLDPVSFKNWTINLVNLFFGGWALAFFIIFLTRLARWLLTDSKEAGAKHIAGVGAVVSLMIFSTIIGVWVTVFLYLNRFQVHEVEPPLEIVTEPAFTYGLTSPIQIQFSAERMTRKFNKGYDIVSYTWDRESDGVVDANGEKTMLYFPHGGKNDGVYTVTLAIKLQPRGVGEQPIETREYQKKVSISKQEIYGEILSDLESGPVPLKVKLDAADIADPHGVNITNYSWDLDADGRPDFDGAAYRRIEKTFDTIGDHTITLIVTSEDLNGDGTHEQKTFTKTISVLAPTDDFGAEAIISATPTVGVAPLTVTFDASESNKINKQKIDRYEWAIGDGTEKFYGVRNTYKFEKIGTYLVTLTVTYFNGLTKTDTVEIKVGDQEFAPTAKISTNPTAKIGQPVSGQAPLTVKFDGRGSLDKDKNIVKYEWDFDGDGFFDGEGSTIEHEYREAGTYSAKLQVTDADGLTSNVQAQIVVGDEAAKVDFGASTLSGTAPLTVDFDASGSRLPGRRIVAYEWDFAASARPRSGSGSSKNSFIYERAQTSHIFDTVGEYLVRLTLHGDDGSTESDTLKIVATYESLAAKYTPSRLRGKSPLVVSFDPTESTGNIAKVLWLFGDGTESSEVKPTHTFTKPGIYEVTFKVYDDQGNVSETSQQITAE